MSKRNNKMIVLVVVVAVLAIGATAYALTMRPNEQASSNKSSTTSESAESMGMTDEEHANMDKSDDATAGSTVIVFTDDGFDKKSYTSKAGEAVTVKNDSEMDLEFSSDDHPTHRENPELNMDVLSAGESGTFTPPGKGTYNFHDHINDQYTGTIVVE